MKLKITSNIKSTLSKIFFIFIGTTLIQAQVSANFGAPKFAPADGKKLLIMGQDLGAVGGLDSYNNGYIDNFTNHRPAGVTSYTSLPTLNGLKKKDNWGAGDVYADAYSNDDSFNDTFIVIGLHLVGVLEDINNGLIDINIRELATWVKEKDRPVFLRMGYEFDGAWNHYDPTQFKNAWRHIVHIFDDEHVQNAAYVWQSSGYNYDDIANWYPGDEYVNWIGYSQFDQNYMGQSTRDFGEVYNKPIMIAEAAPKVDLKIGNPEIYWSNWFEPLFNVIYGSDRIKALAYINVDWQNQLLWKGKGWGDSRVQEVPYIKEKWELEINKPSWITASDTLFDTLNYSDWVTLNNTEIEEDLNNNHLILEKTKGNLQISTQDNEVLKEITILDFSGRVLYRNNVPTTQYNIQTTLLYQTPLIVVATLKNNISYTKKIVLTQE